MKIILIYSALLKLQCPTNGFEREPRPSEDPVDLKGITDLNMIDLEMPRKLCCDRLIMF